MSDSEKLEEIEEKLERIDEVLHQIQLKLADSDEEYEELEKKRSYRLNSEWERRMGDDL